MNTCSRCCRIDNATGGEPCRQTAAGGFVADELGNLAMLHDEEKISDQEYERTKAKIVS